MATDLTYTVQVSEDLFSWADGSSYSAKVTIPNTVVTQETSRFFYDGYEKIHIMSRNTPDVRNVFMRLKLTQDP